MLYSDHEEDNAPHTQGVAFMLSETTQRALTGWEAYGPRILKATFQTKTQKINMDVIQCYAPTNDKVVEEEFYNRLSTIIQNCPRRNITIMMLRLAATTEAMRRSWGSAVRER